MKEVVARLRETDAEALSEIAELYWATSEILLSAQRLAGAVREIAGETSALAGRPPGDSAGRLNNLAEYARNVSSSADSHAIALRELQRGIEGWNLQLTAT